MATCETVRILIANRLDRLTSGALGWNGKGNQNGKRPMFISSSFLDAAFDQLIRLIKRFYYLIDFTIESNGRNDSKYKLWRLVMSPGTLTFFCGKMGAGKSTKSREIAQERTVVLLVEDEWLESLYPNQIASIEDYIRYANQLKPQLKKLVQSILVAGTDVVMDFPANTVSQRDWFKRIFSEIDAPHNLIYIDLPNEVCLQQIGKRRIEHPERATTDTPLMFEQVTKYFVEPDLEEGFNVTRISRTI